MDSPPPPASSSEWLSAEEIEAAELDDLFVFVPVEPAAALPPPSNQISVEGETAGVTLGKLRDAVADAGVNEIASLTITASAGGDNGTANLRALAHCASQLPRFECSVTVSLQVEFDGLEGGVEADIAGGIPEWRRIEEPAWALVDLGIALGGTFAMQLTPQSPIAVDGRDWEQFRSVVANNDPGALRIEAEPAGNAPSGGEQ